jgi:hypothetical protein
VELHQRPHAARGALLPFECLTKKSARCPGLPRPARKAWPEWLSYVPCSREGQGEQSRCFSQPKSPVRCARRNLSCARDQVVIARPPVLTPPWRYRRSLVSKGRAPCPHQRDMCRNPCKPPEKAISRGDRLCRRPPPPPRQGRMLVVSLIIMTRVRIWENIEFSVGFCGCCE